MYLLRVGLDLGWVTAPITELWSVRMVRVGGGEGGRVGVIALQELLSVLAPTEDARVASPWEPNRLVIPVAVL